MPLVLALHNTADSVAEVESVIEAHLRLTHNSDRLVDEAMYMARAIRALLRGEEPLAVIAEAFDRFYEPKGGQPKKGVDQLAELDTETLFVGEYGECLSSLPQARLNQLYCRRRRPLRARWRAWLRGLLVALIRCRGWRTFTRIQVLQLRHR